MNNMPAITGWNWLKEGTGLFRKQPAALTTLLFANILISLLVSAIPLLGPMLTVILIPSFSMAFMQACLLIDKGERVLPTVALTGFRQPALAQLCKVGLIYLAVSLLLTVLARFAVDPAFLQQFSTPVDPKNVPQVNPGDVLTMFALSILNVGVLIALSFAAPLTYWKKMGPGQAVFYSFFAVVKSARVFIVLLASWFGILFAVLMALMLLLGGGNVARVAIMWVLFLFMLLLQCALYAGYRHIFQDREENTARPVDLSK